MRETLPTSLEGYFVVRVGRSWAQCASVLSVQPAPAGPSQQGEAPVQAVNGSELFLVPDELRKFRHERYEKWRQLKGWCEVCELHRVHGAYDGTGDGRLRLCYDCGLLLYRGHDGMADLRQEYPPRTWLWRLLYWLVAL